MRSITAVIVFCIVPLTAQQRQDSTLFDFWIGSWEASWKNPDGSVDKGENIVTKILGGKVIEERFTILTGKSKGFRGMSWSVRDRRTGEWKQTWVDTEEAYLPFTGGANDTSRYFEQEYLVNGAVQKAKMVFHRIEKNSFRWDWMKSADGGRNWTVAWSIDYRRKP